METNNNKADGRPGIFGPGRTVIGKLWRGVLRGAIDGIPFVGPSVNAAIQAKPGEVVQPAARALSSAATVILMVGLAAARLWGDATWDDVMWILSKIFFGV